jgi:KUP system potassium uptake protein
MSHTLLGSRERGKLGSLSLAITALGVVFGDIGTSPLYAFKVAFAGEQGLAVSELHIIAALSALFWSVFMIVSVKYVWIVLSYDNEGEGGVLALTALARRFAQDHPAWTTWIVSGGVFAAALFYGDSIITPAISVLSAVEGLSVAAPRFEPWIVPTTIGIIIALFAIQRNGTRRVGKLFGPIIIIWFAVLAMLGVVSIAKTPAVLHALNPIYAFHFAVNEPHAYFLLLAAVFLAMTGGEALYADMGHFGARAVRVAWYGLVWPALVVNYFGQGALVLRDATAARDPFYLLAPDWFIYPLVILAMAATVIASQATISGAYSMTLQASRLNFLPKVRILHTSDTERGQIYIPAVNWMMLVAVIFLVVQFRSSEALAAAYGIAVSGTMVITTLLLLFVTLRASGRWRWLALASLCTFGVTEVFFLASNLTKVASGGWLPLLLGLIIFMMLTTWKKGSEMVAQERNSIEVPMRDFLVMSKEDIPRVSGTAVYLTSDTKLVPNALFHNLKHYKVMHERVVFLNVSSPDVPYVDADSRLHVEELAKEIFSVSVAFGFREEPNVPVALEGLKSHGIDLDTMSTTFFCARTTIVEGPGKLAFWQRALFSWMTRQSESVALHFHLPPNRVVELGTQVIL